MHACMHTPRKTFSADEFQVCKTVQIPKLKKKQNIFMLYALIILFHKCYYYLFYDRCYCYLLHNRYQSYLFHDKCTTVYNMADVTAIYSNTSVTVINYTIGINCCLFYGRYYLYGFFINLHNNKPTSEPFLSDLLILFNC